jgi:hypothetical protein
MDVMTPQAAQLFQRIAGSLFYQPGKADAPGDVYDLLAAGLIQEAKQGKLSGYVITPAGYARTQFHHQR